MSTREITKKNRTSKIGLCILTLNELLDLLGNHTYKEVAEIYGISVSTVYRICDGKIKRFEDRVKWSYSDCFSKNEDDYGYIYSSNWMGSKERINYEQYKIIERNLTH